MKRNELKPINIPEANPEAGVYNVRIDRVAYAVKKLEKLVKRAGKLGCEPITFAVVEPVTYVIAHKVQPHSDNWYEVFGQFQEIRVGGAAPKFDGWRLIARLLHGTQTGIETGTIVNVVPGETLPEQFRTSGCKCDHCNKKVIRKDTFVVAKGEDFKQIGTSCLRDFLGHVSPENVVALATYYSDGVAGCFADDDRDETPESLWVKGARLASAQEMLEVVSAHHRVFGWTTAAQAKDSYGAKHASVGTVVSVMFYPAVTDDDKKLRKDLEPTEQDAINAKAAIEWAKALPGNSDFEYNLRTIATAGTVSNRTIGLGAAIYGAYRKATEVVGAKSEKVETAYIGAVGERVALFGATVTASRCIGESQYGPKWLIKFADKDGNPLTWFTGTEAFETGQVVNIRATVKKHEEFRGVKQTLISIVKEI